MAMATTAKAAQVARMAWTKTSEVEAPAATQGMSRELKGALVIAAQPKPHMRRHPEGPAVLLENKENRKLASYSRRRRASLE